MDDVILLDVPECSGSEGQPRDTEAISPSKPPWQVSFAAGRHKTGAVTRDTDLGHPPVSCGDECRHTLRLISPSDLLRSHVNVESLRKNICAKTGLRPESYQKMLDLLGSPYRRQCLVLCIRKIERDGRGSVCYCRVNIPVNRSLILMP